jgi:hypothetical protein
MDVSSVPAVPQGAPVEGEGEAAGPRFCPRCGRTGPEGPKLCADCGETLIIQGYCDVCEAHWTLAPGTLCPKHELPISVRSVAPAWDCPGAIGTRWVTVRNFPDALRAEAPRIRLEAEGIPTFLEGERMGSPSMYQVATGGVKLQVPESLVADARVLLAQSWSHAVTGADETDDEDDLDDAWDDLAPDPSAVWRDLGRAAVLFVLFAPLLLSLLSLWLNRR